MHARGRLKCMACGWVYGAGLHAGRQCKCHVHYTHACVHAAAEGPLQQCGALCALLALASLPPGRSPATCFPFPILVCTHSWDAQLIVLDNRPFPDLRHLVKDMRDPRIRVFAEWVGAHTTSPIGGWMLQIHICMQAFTLRLDTSPAHQHFSSTCFWLLEKTQQAAPLAHFPPPDHFQGCAQN